MSGSGVRLALAKAWWDTQPGAARPVWEDVEVLARLGVRHPSSVSRLVLADRVLAGRHFAALLAALDAENDRDAVDALAPAEEQLPVEVGVDEAVVPGLPGPQVEQGDAAVRAYVHAARAEGSWDDSLDDGWITRVLDDPANLNQMPVSVARKHRKQLRVLLGDGTGSAGRARTPGADAALFTLPPTIQKHSADHGIAFSTAPDGATVLTWPEVPPGRFAWFKAYAGEGGRQPVLHEGRLVGQGEDPRLSDTDHLGSGRKQYAVWAYIGVNPSEAASAGPRLWARGVHVSTVADLQVAVTDGQVAGTWTVDESVDHVEVHHRSVSGESNPVNPQGRLVGGDHSGANRAGFTDDDLPAGEHLYEFTAVSIVEGVTHRSASVTRQVRVSVPVAEVTALNLTVDEATRRLRASWAVVPGVQVELHRTDRPPEHGMRGQELDAAGLERGGLGDDTRVTVPTVRAGDRESVDFAWPEDWSRIHVVAVSRVDSSYKVGAAATRARVGRITAATLLERVDQQYLVFTWPAGAARVLVRRQLDTEESDPTAWTEVGTIAEEQHNRYGGLHLYDLPPEGCRLSIVGMAHQDGRTEWGLPHSIDYPGLRRIRYHVKPTLETQRPRGWLRRDGSEPVVTGERITVTCEPAEAVEVFLIVRPDRLPLHGRDVAKAQGPDPVRLGRLSTVGAMSEGSFDLPPVARSGWIRLFVDVPDDQQSLYAVLDPSVSSLRRGA